MGKRLGQHFLQSPQVLEGIMEVAGIRPGEQVLEIGPGQGALTAHLLAAKAEVTAVELDPRLCQALQERWGTHKGLRIIGGDILQLDLQPARLFGSSRPYAVIANLPYYLSTPWFFRMIAQRACCSRMVLMVQKEIAERVIALPAAGKAYGALSVAASHALHTSLRFTVPPGAFRPPPKVTSALLSLQPKPTRLTPAAEQGFFTHVQQLFTTRRKQMLKPLLRRYPQLSAERRKHLQELLAQRRAEDLHPEEHLQLYRFLTMDGGGENDSKAGAPA